VIGVTLGDGSLNRRGYNRRIRLQSIDLEFVLEFDRCLSKVLGTRRHTPWFDTKRREIHIEARSVLLYNFLNQPWGLLKPWISHCSSCVSMFLRGFFDSECCVDKKGSITCSNSDVELLLYVQQLLEASFTIETTGPRVNKCAGTKISNRGRTYIRQRDCYYIYVRAGSLGKFSREIGLTIQRKRVRLETRLRMHRS